MLGVWLFMIRGQGVGKPGGGGEVVRVEEKEGGEGRSGRKEGKEVRVEGEEVSVEEVRKS